jgi:cobalt-zinc-cadmium resistance protein CzcA
VSGVKGELAIKVYGTDLKVLEQTGDQIVKVMSGIRGVEDLGLFRVIGQPNLNFTVDRFQASRFGLNVSDVQDAIETAVGGNAVTQVLDGERRFDVVPRYQAPYRDTREAIENVRLLAPTGERVSLAQLCKVATLDGASEIYREANYRYVAIKYSVRGRDLGSTVEEAIKKVGKQVKLPEGYSINWAGEYASQQRSQKRLAIVLPITILVIFIILYTMFHSFKWAALMLVNMAMAPLGGLRGVRANRRDHAGIHQSASRARTIAGGCRGGRRGIAAAPDYDDHAGGYAGAIAGGAVARDRVGFAEALRHRHRGRTDGGDVNEYFPAALAICMDRTRFGCFAGIGARI